MFSCRTSLGLVGGTSNPPMLNRITKFIFDSFQKFARDDFSKKHLFMRSIQRNTSLKKKSVYCIDIKFEKLPYRVTALDYNVLLRPETSAT